MSIRQTLGRIKRNIQRMSLRDICREYKDIFRGLFDTPRSKLTFVLMLLILAGTLAILFLFPPALPFLAGLLVVDASVGTITAFIAIGACIFFASFHCTSDIYWQVHKPTTPKILGLVLLNGLGILCSIAIVPGLAVGGIVLGAGIICSLLANMLLYRVDNCIQTFKIGRNLRNMRRDLRSYSEDVFSPTLDEGFSLRKCFRALCCCCSKTRHQDEEEPDTPPAVPVSTSFNSLPPSHTPPPAHIPFPLSEKKSTPGFITLSDYLLTPSTNFSSPSSVPGS